MQAKINIGKYIPGVISRFFLTGHHRTVTLKKNALGGFFLLCLDTVIGFVRIPLIISFVSVTEYGIWLTLSSIIAWFSFFDIGLTSGLKTKLAEALAKKDYNLARVYISTTYATISIIVGSVFLLFIFIFPFLSWASILNVPKEMSSQTGAFVFVFVSLFTVQFVVGIISTVLTADQKPALGSAIGGVASVIYLLLLFILKIFSKGSLLYLTLACNGTTAIVFIIASFYFYSRRYKHISPNIKSIDFKHFRSLASLGAKFFFLKVGGIIMFTTDNMIITQLFTPADVAPYSISLKFMSIPMMFFSLITQPLWTAYTDAYTVRDIEWIKKTINRLVVIWGFMILAVGILLAASPKLYDIWLRGEVQIPILLSAFMGVYTILLAWNQIYVFFLNGVGKIKLQLYMNFITIILNIPLSIYFARDLKIGPAGVMLATIVCIFIGSIWAPIQYHKIINGRAKGIWDA
jgi:O-antigen/teichoic acid export membrane protein